MIEQQRPSSRQDFEIALVCALQLEFDAVCLVIDQFWDNEGDVYGRSPGDHNTYTTGVIGKHNVVVTLLGMGKTNSASSAANLRSSYPNIKLAILVGICGGVPLIGEKQVRFGDVVISEKVVQYDFGRQTDNGFIRKNTPEDGSGAASKDVLNLLNYLDTDHGRYRLRRRTAVFFDKLREIATKSDRSERYSPPYAAQADAMDLDHQSSWSDSPGKHEDQGDGTTELLPPAIYRGPIASGDMVIKSAEYREKLAQTEGVIAFEMEGAGVWRALPCIIVKGVCDYADSEKTKVWQDFAAAMAAATSKAILEAYVQTDKPNTTAASPLPTARQGGSSYTNKVEGKKDVHQGNTMTVSSSRPPQNYVQEGSKFGGDVRAEENAWQGNSMSFS